jgi:hypothetical protein
LEAINRWLSCCLAQLLIKPSNMLLWQGSND